MDSKSVEEMGIKYFYAHSYCSYERGSNENNNKLIRRFIKKGEDTGKYKYSKSFIKKIERFMNEYPRKMFNEKSANYVYEKNYALYWHLLLQFIFDNLGLRKHIKKYIIYLVFIYLIILITI